MRRATGPHADGGMVTVETAIALAAFVVVVSLGIGGIVAVLDQLRCTDAAREAARLVARGERDRAAEAVRRIAPAGATLAVSMSGDEITVGVRSAPVGALLPGLHVAASAFAVAEAGVVGTSAR